MARSSEEEREQRRLGIVSADVTYAEMITGTGKIKCDGDLVDADMGVEVTRKFYSDKDDVVGARFILVDANMGVEVTPNASLKILNHDRMRFLSSSKMNYLTCL